MYPHAARHPRLVRGPSKDVSSDLRYEKGGKADVTNAVVVNLDSVGSAFASSIFLFKYGRRKRTCMLSRKCEINNYNTDKCWKSHLYSDHTPHDVAVQRADTSPPQSDSLCCHQTFGKSRAIHDMKSREHRCIGDHHIPWLSTFVGVVVVDFKHSTEHTLPFLPPILGKENGRCERAPNTVQVHHHRVKETAQRRDLNSDCSK